MTKKKLLSIGLAGTVISALCCFTPILVLIFGILGLSSILGAMDIILLPSLAVFVAITGYALWKKHDRD